jgi:hypothetical protein
MDHEVTDYDPRVKEQLERQVPLRLDAQSDWPGALRKAEGGPESSRLAEWIGLRMRSRSVLVPALVVVVLSIAAGTTAGARWWNGPATPIVIDTTKATKLVDYTLIASIGVYIKGYTIALWRMPQPDGSVCVFTALASPKPTAPGTGGPNPALGGGFCSLSDGEPRVLGGGRIVVPEDFEARQPKTIRVVSLSGGKPPAGMGWVIEGTVSSDSGIARLEIQSDAESFPLAYSQGWFLGQLPASSSTSDLPSQRDLAPRGQYVIVGYDSKGTAIERLDLRQAFGISAAPSGN